MPRLRPSGGHAILVTEGAAGAEYGLPHTHSYAIPAMQGEAAALIAGLVFAEG